jgi:N-glycosylase/DNA lyase
LRLDVPFDLDFSLCCGQVFRWKKEGDWWFGVVGDRIIKIRQYGCRLEFEGTDEEFVRHYFSLDVDLEKIRDSIAQDNHIKTALKQFEGLRLVRQEPWTCLVGFECSIQKNIPAIEQMLERISIRFGEKKVFDKREFHMFPSVDQLALASEKSLRECGLGFRAKYVQATAQKILDENIDLYSFKALPYVEARKALLEFCGVGLKVADCVLLFSMDKTEAFPVDIWVKRVILNRYSRKLPEELVKKLHSHPTLTKSEYQKIGDFARGYFGKYAGYAQEYLYHYERTKR